MLTLFPKSDPVHTDQIRYVFLPAHQLAWLNCGTVEARGSGDIDCVAPSGRRHARPGSLLATRSQRGAVLYLKEVRPHLVANTLHRIRQHDNDNALLKYVVIGLTLDQHIESPRECRRLHCPRGCGTRNQRQASASMY